MPEEQTFIPPEPLHTAVLFLIYKRPDTTKQVFEAIRQAKPPRLYVSADGPKAGVPGEAERVQQARDIVLNGVDWDCEVKTLFRDTNLGCKYGVSGGIDWFFEHEEEGIILEDDTLPSQSFFWFCQELLERYRDDQRVWHIGGHDQSLQSSSNQHYHFSRYTPIWGWATWSNRWKEYDVELLKFKRTCRSWFSYDIYKTNKEMKNRYKLLSKVYKNQIDTWDYQWNFCIRINSGLCTRPNINMVENIGFGLEATHTTKKPKLINKKKEISLPVKHPDYVLCKYKEDIEFFKKGNTSYIKKIFGRLRKIYENTIS